MFLCYGNKGLYIMGGCKSQMKFSFLAVRISSALILRLILVLDIPKFVRFLQLPLLSMFSRGIGAALQR